VLDRLRRNGIFVPWLPVGDNGEVDEESCQRLFSRWHERGKIKQMRETGLHPVPPAASALGGMFIYGGEQSLVEGDLYKPVIIGRRTRVRKKATIGNCTIVGDRAQIGTAHVARSVLFPGAKIASSAVVGDSIIGPGARIESVVLLRSKTGRRSQRGTIVIIDFRDPEQPEIDTGRKVLGTICGRGCLVEATLEPGCVLLPDCHVRSWMVGLEGGIYSPDLLDRWDEEHRREERLSKRWYVS
jgi:NDP-sugar pyrophosphorylase family protein